MNTQLKTTALHQWHRDAGANMAEFGGFDMPLWYETGVKNEHLAVLTSAGIFDTSHMACIMISGKDAFDLLNFCFTRDLGTLNIGRCVYGAFLDERGFCMDDAIVYKFDETRFMVCVNAGMGAVVSSHINAQKNKKDVLIEDLSGKVAKMDIQGKNAARILSKLIKNPESVFNKMPYFSFKGHFLDEKPDGRSNEVPGKVFLLDGTPILLSRSGYTGEFGFEIFIDPAAIETLWKETLSVGAPFGIMACGLGARDSLRAGACLPLSHQDIGPWKFFNHPWTFALPFSSDQTTFTKDFFGAKALTETCDTYVFPFVGETLRKVNAQDATVFAENQKNIGRVLTCATDMGIDWLDDKIVSINTPGLPQDKKIKGISCGFVMVSTPLEPGTKLTLKEGKRSIPVTIVTDIRPDRTARMKLDNFI